MARRSALLAILLLGWAMAGCATLGSPVPASGTTAPGPPGVTASPSPRTAAPGTRILAPSDPQLVSGDNAGAVCPLVILAVHVTGRLEGDAADPAWPVWLKNAAGHRLYVRWPAGYSVSLRPALALFDERSGVVGTQDAMIELPQVAPGSHAGTRDDPYLASGLVFGRCYVESPDASP